MKLFELHSIWTERVCLRTCGHTSGPVVTTWVSDCQGNEAAQEGITRGSKNGDQFAERKARHGAATDSCAVGEQMPQLRSNQYRSRVAATRYSGSVRPGSEPIRSARRTLPAHRRFRRGPPPGNWIT